MFDYIGISLEKLLMLNLLKGAKVIGGNSGIKERITKVNVMEVPDIIEWVSKGEFLITTAYSIKDNIDILVELIPKLKEKGVVGLGIKVGRYVSELPKYIINLSDELGFPIIEVPFCVSHTDIISVILTEVINDQMNMLLKMENFNREVMDIMIKGGNLREIGRKLYDNIGNSLAIYESMNDSYEIICEDDSYKEIIDKIIYAHASSKFIADKHKQEKKFITTEDDVNGRLIQRVTIPIVIENIEYGCIFIWLDNKPLTPLDNMLIESYVHIIALEFVKKISLYNMESNYKLEFFDDLLSQKESRKKRAIEKAKTFNLKRELRYSVIVILLKDLCFVDKYINKKENNTLDSISSLLFIINRMAKYNGGNLVYVDKSDRIIVLYGSDGKNNFQQMKKEVITFCEKVLSEWERNHKAFNIVIGIGRCPQNVEELWKSYDQAKLIVENLSKNINKSIIHYDDLGLYRILSFDGLQNELKEFCSDTIKPLIDYDELNNSELIKTLKNYFKYNGNMKKISEKMYVHYNTIIYRLQKIRDITGKDIDDGDTRLNFEMALKIIDLGI